MPNIDEDAYKVLEKYALAYGVSLGYVENVYLNMVTPRVSSEEILQKFNELEFNLKDVKSGLKPRMLYLKSRGIVSC